MRKRDEKQTDWLYKHYMTERDFEVEHALDTNYHEVAPHYHEFYEMFFFAGGHVDYIVNDELFHLQPGDLLIIPPNILHNPIFLDFAVPYERYVVWISANALGRLIRQDPDCGYFLRDDTPQMYLLRGDEAARGALRGSFVTLSQSYRNRELCYRSEGLSVITGILVDYNRALAAKSGTAQSGSRNTLLSSILRLYPEQPDRRPVARCGCRCIFLQQIQHFPHFQAEYEYFLLPVRHPDAADRREEQPPRRRPGQQGLGDLRVQRPRGVLPRVPQMVRRQPERV